MVQTIADGYISTLNSNMYLNSNLFYYCSTRLRLVRNSRKNSPTRKTKNKVKLG